VQRGTGTDAPAPLRTWILRLQRSAGNRAVRSLLQRETKWSDASKKGKAWNAGERKVGNVRRIPLEGLGEGLRSGHKIAGLSSENAGGKAIVLVPAELKPAASIEVVVFLHGYTEGTFRPYAGWRALDTNPSVAGMGKELEERLPRLRQGIDKDDTAPVRDVALDQVAQQLEESGQTQLVIVLPQGGLRSEFGKDGTQSFNAKRYVAEVVTKLKTEGVWSEEPHVTRVAMAGHSGAGAALSKMADAGELKGDLVLYDAINGDYQAELFKQWTLKRLEDDFAKVTDPGVTDEGKLWYLNRAQKLRGYTTDAYISRYIALDEAINRWFAAKADKLGPWARCLRANFTLEFVDVSHEELMRGSLAGKPREAGTGTIVDAIRSLHPPRYMNTRSCPPMPEPLKDRWQRAKGRAKGG
jgi:hypothetical protein